MKKLSLSSIGILLLLATQNAAADDSLYDTMKKQVEKDTALEQVEPEIGAFTQAVMREAGITLTLDQIKAAVVGDASGICGTLNDESASKSYLGCSDLMQRIQSIVTRERNVRQLGRTLQLTATSYELPISDLPGRSLKLSSDMRGIIDIWSAGTGSIKSSVPQGLVHFQKVDESKVQPPLQALGNALKALSDEQMIAAVWHYQYGIRLLSGDRMPYFPAPFEDTESGPGTERQYLFKDQAAVESELRNLWDAIKTDTFTPPLSANETVFYLFPETLLASTLPNNVIVWARLDGKDPEHPFGDVGLQWKLPLLPVLPSLMRTDNMPILGGNYPPEPLMMSGSDLVPLEGKGLCSDPIQQRGFLCRTLTGGDADRCPITAATAADPTSISLVTCVKKSERVTTISGPDVCRDINWRNPKPFDIQNNCKLNIFCDNACGSSETAGSLVLATASQKKMDGTVDVCINKNATNKVNMTYGTFHEFIHAYQFCGMPPSTTDLYDTVPYEQANDLCCRIEGEAYRMQCDVMERDGVFEGQTADGKPINAETCAEIGTDNGCKSQKSHGKALKGCYTSTTYSQPVIDKVFELFDANPKGLPDKCPDVIDALKMDPRLSDLKKTIERKNDICKPGQTDLFKNRIGNNMCYIGQCVEESVEMHRMTGAQSPATVQDESYPWNDPTTGAALGNLLINPPLAPTLLPNYEPQNVVTNMETALCQLQGLPPQTPPILCTLSAARRIGLPLSQPIANAKSFIQQMDDQQLATRNAQQLSLGLGSRIGTEFYATYLHTASRSLAELLSMAGQLFKEMIHLDFPTQMCPTDDALPPARSASSTSSAS